MFSVFGEQRLEYVDNNTSSVKIAEWKTSEKTRAAYGELFSNHELLTKIGYTVFKQYKEKNLPTMHCAYVLSICDILLNPKSLGIKCNDKSVARRVNAFMVNIFAGKTTLKYFVYIKYIYLINSKLMKVKFPLRHKL